MGKRCVRGEPGEGDVPAESSRIEVDVQRGGAASASRDGRHFLIAAQGGDDGDGLTARLALGGDEVQDRGDGPVVAGGARPSYGAFKIGAVAGGAGTVELPAVAAVIVDGVRFRGFPGVWMADAAVGSVVAGQAADICDAAIEGTAVAGGAVFRLNHTGGRLGAGEERRQISGDFLNITEGKICLPLHDGDEGDRPRDDGPVGTPDIGSYLSRSAVAVAYGAAQVEKDGAT